MLTEEELYERRRLLRIEGELAAAHRSIAKIQRLLEYEGPQDLADSVLAALWHLGVAIINVAEREPR